MHHVCESSYGGLIYKLWKQSKNTYFCIILECTVYIILNKAKVGDLGCKLNPDMNVEPDAANVVATNMLGSVNEIK